MNINDIQLPGQVISELYRTSLVMSDENIFSSSSEKKVESTVSAAGLKGLGNNQKNILVIVQYPDAVHIPDKELDFLTTMLGACKLSLDDVAIVNIHHHTGSSYRELTGLFKSKIVLLFDTEPAAFGLPMSFPHYQLQGFGGATFLYAPSLTELENDKLQKSKLWVSLKRLFNL